MSRLRVMVTGLLFHVAFVGTAVAEETTATEILENMDANLTFDSQSASLKMEVVNKRGRVKAYEMTTFSRGEVDSAMEYLAPARDRGTKMLKATSELWLYLPAIEKTQKVSGHMLRQGMMGSDFSYEDLLEARSFSGNYKATIAGEETREGVDVWRVDMTSTSEDVAYPKRRVWVAKETFIPVFQELYALSGELLKTWEMSDIQQVDGRHWAMKMVAKDRLAAPEGSEARTTVTFTDVKFSVPVEEEVFSLRWLER